ncbi:hypothetical protein BD324DRAFT_656397 [Kockovaella imperatae]|uniref:Rap1-interacting factor 1 N terminal-domain-containing protein n=1 Tax=Kockovaella imperatae TaxID=4999 RepID=A0A1Y1UGS9_9TREE|nr:hypothetical protein BD324DRAFT_656397 [Kockovaella imperatae]ORX37271.1 hypothetical protein BD324DRAFT_656397 [Kockovaella imperatae]
MSIVAHSHSVSFSVPSDEILPASSSSSSYYCHAQSSSPSKRVVCRNSTAGPSRSEPLLPLAPAKTVALTRRAVNFSPRTQTKLFHSDHSIIPSIDDPPPKSIRSYHQDTEASECLPLSSSPVETSSSPSSSPSSQPRSTPHRSSPSILRSILKARVSEIRIASSVEEGTLNNKEPARLIVTGSRPRLQARDSFQLAMLRKAASDGIADDMAYDPLDKGKGRLVVDPLGSDDSAASDEPKVADDQSSNASEEEEEVEASGELASESLVRMILDGPQELLSLEEAYNTLGARLRHRFDSILSAANSSPASKEVIRLATQPLRDEAPAMVRAMQRDVLRILGRISNDATEDDSTPFADLKPLTDSNAVPIRSRFTPSPSATPSTKSSPTKPLRRGYTEAEVKFRREASGVGQAVLRFLTQVFSSSHLWECFTQADLTSLLDKVLLVPRIARLPTPNQKRSYMTAMLLLSSMKLPEACILPVKDKVVRAIEAMFNDALGSPPGSGVPSLKDMGQAKREAYHAIINIINHYPSVFFAEYASLLPICLRGLTSNSLILRNKASAAAASFVAAKLNMLYDRSNADEWSRNRPIVQRSEAFVVSHLKSVIRPQGRGVSTIYNSTGERRMEWMELERMFKDTVGAAGGVAWACATWSIIMSLMGQAYETSTFAAGPSGMNHIMDRSLVMTTNGVRPLFASVAWCHAIHSYLMTNSAVSLNDKGGLVQSFSPWVSTSANDWQSRLETILMPVEFALAQAADSKNFSTELVKGKWQWNRAERTKQHDWMVTTGKVAAAIIYAYSGTAIYHMDQPAKEISAITGMPSSDGVSTGDADAEEDAKLERLDKVWDRVARPLIKRLTSLCGVDELKTLGWEILLAITRPETSTQADWSLDRLCSARYLSGEVFVEKEILVPELKMKLEADVIRPVEIPSWGSAWVASRLDKVLDLYQEIISSMTGLSRPISPWISTDRDHQILPTILSHLWSNVMHALGTLRENKTEAETFNQGLVLVLRHLLQIFNRDPASHVPLARLCEDAKTIRNADSFRLDLFSHLLHIAIDLVGTESFSSVRLTPAQAHSVDAFIAAQALGSDANGRPTIAGGLLGQMLRSPHQVLSLPLEESSRITFSKIVRRIVDVGSTAGFAGKLLGDITNALPFMFEQQEELRLDVWRIAACQWVKVIDLQPSATASVTNHTGELLVTLLSCPFRAVSVSSAWHSSASSEDLQIWQDLLKTVVLRFRAKRVGSNMGVLENLAGHLRDFLEQGAKTSSSTITLSCLASALSWLSFVPVEAHHANHFSINENYVPIDFLALVSNALLDSYPGEESQANSSLGELHVISPAVGTLLRSLSEVIKDLPAEFVSPVLDACRPGLVCWMSDEIRLASEEIDLALDELYISVLSALSGAVGAGAIPANGQTLEVYLDVYAPRLSRARSARVPAAFQAFWASLRTISAADMSAAVRSFAKQILSAVPGMIIVSGLDAPSVLSEEESQSLFPHALQVKPVPGPAPQQSAKVLVDASEMEIDPAMFIHDHTEAYDADVSQLETQRVQQVTSSSDRSAQVADSGVSGTSSSASGPPATMAIDMTEEVHNSTVDMNGLQGTALSVHVEVGGDVFGPTGHSSRRTKRRRRAGRSRNSSRSQSLASMGQPEQDAEWTSARDAQAHVDLVPSSGPRVSTGRPLDSGPASDGTEEKSEPIEAVMVEASHPTWSESNRNRPSLLSSAKGWLSRVPSFTIFSPTRGKMDAEDPVEQIEDFSMEQIEVGTPVQASISANKGKTISKSGLSHATPISRHSPLIDLTVLADDEDDELLLSPETARKRKREEDEAIKVMMEETAKSKTESTRRTRSSKKSKIGDHDGDIEEFSSLPRPTRAKRSGGSSASIMVDKEQGSSSGTGSAAASAPSLDSLTTGSPSTRTNEQIRLLAMLDEAAAASRAVDSMDLEGVLSMMRSLDALKVAAQENLERIAARRHADRKARKRD